MRLQSKKTPRVYITLRDPTRRKQLGLTVLDATLDEVRAKLEQTFNPPAQDKSKPLAA